MSDASQSPQLTSGWVTFSAILFTIAGIGNLVWGVNALEGSDAFYAAGLVWTGLNTWGWIAVVWGVVVLLAASLLYMRKASGAVLGVLVSMLSATFWFFVLPALPVFSLIAILLNAMVIYGLTVASTAPRR